MVKVSRFFAKVPLIRHVPVILETYKCSQEDRHEQLSVAAGRRGNDPFDLTGAVLTTDELAASRSGDPARPERKSGPCPLFFCVRMYSICGGMPIAFSTPAFCC
ncbi:MULTISPECIES: hypothetical protein [Rhizobium]|uniref:hypothetical protein n=1 Tax=Rhizobium phaseoli TaxID=396 RepID=UPI000A1C15D1|nr:hypothetical protein [Rhizobium phaseoli]ARM10430.1 hypothetical protein Bra5_CH00143 [Rhizobium phaseoli Brasil 5]